MKDIIIFVISLTIAILTTHYMSVKFEIHEYYQPWLTFIIHFSIFLPAVYFIYKPRNNNVY